MRKITIEEAAKLLPSEFQEGRTVVVHIQDRDDLCFCREDYGGAQGCLHVYTSDMLAQQGITIIQEDTEGKPEEIAKIADALYRHQIRDAQAVPAEYSFTLY